jgi:hypothetical protein
MSENLTQSFEGLICPRSKAALAPVAGAAFDASRLVKIARTPGSPSGNYGAGDGRWFLTLADGSAYGVADGFPVLMYPEKLVVPGNTESVDLHDPRYEEAYEPPDTYPSPEYKWIDARHDALSQFDAYSYLAPLAGKRFLQLGGSGSHAVKALLAGATKATLLTPMLGEARQGRALAEFFGVADRFHAVIAIGEELPFADGTYDAIFSGGCIHHMRTEYAFREIHRVLSVNGRFAAVDPWKTPLHTIGTRIFGKREPNVHCRPIDSGRLAPISIFSKSLVRRHGPFLRYIFIVLEKAGILLPIDTMLAIGKLDDGVARTFGLLDSYGGSIVFAGEK